MLRQHHPTRPLPAFLALLLCAALTLPVLAVPKTKKTTYKQQIAHMEEQWIEAQRTNDAATIDSLLADDYIGISAQGMVTTKAQAVARIQGRQTTINKLDVHDQKISVHGDTAIVTSQVEFDATNNTTQPPTHIHSKLRYTRVYLRYPSGTWKIVNFESTHISDMPGFGQEPVAAAPPPASAKP